MYIDLLMKNQVGKETGRVSLNILQIEGVVELDDGSARIVFAGCSGEHTIDVVEMRVDVVTTINEMMHL